MPSRRNGRKGEREQYFEGVTVVSLVMRGRWNGWMGRLMFSGCDGEGSKTAAPHAAENTVE